MRLRQRRPWHCLRALTHGLGLIASLAVLVEPARAASGGNGPMPQVLLPINGLGRADIALVVNDADPASVETGRYYAAQRQLAPEQIVHVSFEGGQATMPLAVFERIQSQLRAQLPTRIQAYALAWTQPYRVECMSITSAFAFGFNRDFCAEGCQVTRASPYFDSPSSAPHTELGLRPAMMLAGRSVEEVRALIDRGLRADDRWPTGTAYLLSTGDRKRNVRADTYDAVRAQLRTAYALRRLDANALEGAQDVMFYFTGAQQVAAVASNRFLDGAVADHLTSLGGMLTDSSQMSALDWLSAGATGSFGNTVEPCNYLTKFPDIGVLMRRYLGGETLIEAYWKSVRMPGQGVFVGDPLARPFGGVRIERKGRELVLRTHTLRPGRYAVQQAPGVVGPYRNLGQLVVGGAGVQEVRLPLPAGTGVFRLLPLAAPLRR